LAFGRDFLEALGKFPAQALGFGLGAQMCALEGGEQEVEGVHERAEGFAACLRAGLYCGQHDAFAYYLNGLSDALACRLSDSCHSFKFFFAHGCAAFLFVKW